MKLRMLLVLMSFLILISCANNKSIEPKDIVSSSSENQPSESNKTYVILNRIPFSERNSVPYNVKAECTEIGSQFSNSIVRYSDRNKIKILQIEELLSVEKNIVVINIESVFSAGNAFIGHRKSVTARAKLLVDGTEVSQQSFTRNSRGGFMGGFKSSCAVLAHTVNTLGNDIGKWLRTF